MIKKLLLLATLGVVLSGCYMVPLALVGPASSGFSTASIAQSATTTSLNLVVKKATGKTVTMHAFDAMLGDQIALITQGVLQQTYLPRNISRPLIIAP